MHLFDLTSLLGSRRGRVKHKSVTAAREHRAESRESNNIDRSNKIDRSMSNTSIHNGEIRRCHMPAFLDAYEDAAWVQRLSKERLSGMGRLSATLERHKPGSSTMSVVTIPSIPASSSYGRSWKPLDRSTSPLFATSRAASAIDLTHGVSGLMGKSLSNTTSLPRSACPPQNSHPAQHTSAEASVLRAAA